MVERELSTVVVNEEDKLRLLLKVHTVKNHKSKKEKLLMELKKSQMEQKNTLCSADFLTDKWWSRL